MRANALSIAAAFLALVAASDHACAQDTVPETPPDLRNFRLDPERARPQAEPQPTIEPTTIAPPPVVPAQPETSPSRPAARPAPTRPAQSDSVVPTPENLPTTESLPEAAQPQITEEAVAPKVDDAVATQPPASSAPMKSFWWLIALVLGLGAMALFAFVFGKRRTTLQAADPDWEAPVGEEQTGEPVPESAISPTVAPSIVQPPAASPLIALGFIPEKATISFTALTVRGQLQLINEGTAPAKNLQLRAGLISASAQQAQVIEAFNQNSASIQAKPLADVQPDERVGIAIELSVPLAELQSFPVGNQQLLVPIVVANLNYGDEITLSQRVHLACMIGRESDPSQPKMGPLRLDLGPRSYAPLGQRSIAA